MRKIFLLCIIMLLSFTEIACKRSSSVRLATGGVTGTYYSYGNVISRILSSKTKIPIIVQSTGASKANIQLISSGIVEFAIVQNDVMDYAWRGVDLFSGQQTKNFTAVAALYTEVCQIVANPASGIKTVADLRGKNVSVGNLASGTEFNARQILEAYGINFDQINKEFLDFGDSADAIRERKIDAFFCVAGAPTPAISDLAKEMELVILEIEDEQADALVGKYPFYTKFIIPAGSYEWQNNTINTVAVKATLIANTSVKEDTVYKLTKALFENKAEIEASHVKGGELNPSFAVESISVPFHPGAEKYYFEAGTLSILEIKDTISGKLYGSRYLNERGEFSVEFVHSVNQSPVRETFKAEDGKILPVNVYFYSFGAGMQSGLEDGQIMNRDGSALVISGYKTPYNELNYIVGTVSDHLLCVNDEAINLSALCGTNAQITMRVR